MARPVRQDFQIYVYRPNGWLLTKFTESATTSKAAVARAKKRIYQQGRLAHFYTYVSKSIN